MSALVASAPPVAVDAGIAEIVLLVAGIGFTLAVVVVFGTVILKALRAERRAEEERRRLRERYRERSDAEGPGRSDGEGAA